MGFRKRRIERLLDEREQGPSPQALQAGLVQLAQEGRKLSESVKEFRERLEKLEEGPASKEFRDGLFQGIQERVDHLSERIHALEEKSSRGRMHEIIDGSDARVAIKAIERFEARLTKVEHQVFGVPEEDL